MVNETGTLSDAAQRVEDRIESAKDSLGARVKERAGQVADTVKQQAANVREKIRRTNWDDVMNNATGYVRDNPGKSIGIALGVGFALGVLLRRRGDD
jgi:ElaB/YqjD/DUF883 family membrane-anchored ribosome-binding protein